MIAALLSSRVRRWAVTTVAAPVVAWGLDQVADELDRRKGAPTKAASTVRQARDVVDRVSGRRRRTPEGPSRSRTAAEGLPARRPAGPRAD